MKIRFQSLVFSVPGTQPPVDLLMTGVNGPVATWNTDMGEAQLAGGWPSKAYRLELVLWLRRPVHSLGEDRVSAQGWDLSALIYRTITTSSEN